MANSLEAPLCDVDNLLKSDAVAEYCASISKQHFPSFCRRKLRVQCSNCNRCCANGAYAGHDFALLVLSQMRLRKQPHAPCLSGLPTNVLVTVAATFPLWATAAVSRALARRTDAVSATDAFRLVCAGTGLKSLRVRAVLPSECKIWALVRKWQRYAARAAALPCELQWLISRALSLATPLPPCVASHITSFLL